MPILKPWDVTLVHVGDTRPNLLFTITDQDMVTLKDLTGYAAYVRFWYRDSTFPHVQRAATVDGANGLIRYKLRGDEYTKQGTVFIQWTLLHPDAQNGSRGRGFYRTSGPVIERKVLD